MKTDPMSDETHALGTEETADSVEFQFAMDRRTFVQVLGAGVIIAVSAPVSSFDICMQQK